MLEWLSEHGGWLLVFDNADDVDLFFGPLTMTVAHKQMHEYLPRCEDGTTIVITCDKRVGYRLSLAITQAAAFITENNITLSEYLKVLRINELEVEDLLCQELGDHRRYSDSSNSIMNTLKLSFDQIVEQKPLAADTLSFMAFLDRNGILRTLLKRHGVGTVDLTTALGVLQAFSLISAEKGTESFEMHRLVQLSLQRWLIGIHGRNGNSSSSNFCPTISRWVTSTIGKSVRHFLLMPNSSFSMQSRISVVFSARKFCIILLDLMVNKVAMTWRKPDMRKLLPFVRDYLDLLTRIL